MGFWLSQPFPVKKSDGSEIYVLLMDTQGLFDRFSNSRDWSTIVGFSLLVSSCVIFNVFNSLDEKIFETFDTFIKYGLEAMNTKNDQTAPFQKLVSLFIVEMAKPCDFRRVSCRDRQWTGLQGGGVTWGGLAG